MTPERNIPIFVWALGVVIFLSFWIRMWVRSEKGIRGARWQNVALAIGCAMAWPIGAMILAGELLRKRKGAR